ncbi:hypothetical protein ALC57_06611, partial [Trachymyrmex cornetzi]
GIDSVASVAHTRVYLATPKDNDSEVAAAAGTAVEAAVEAVVEAAVEAAVDKRQIAARNPIDSAVDIVEGMAVRNSEAGNPTDYIAPTVRTPAAVALAGVH